eukprot:TRINITY_DN55462_c0_g1_i1.p1 TRINITY_DN55462_c0_g1~~TRINITY_DN55462_c0_g1_i1.p1  ORF type:complete len:495 (+),score=59.31 TRINITY_DN55462_c0_g1_i1:150-1487(+)
MATWRSFGFMFTFAVLSFADMPSDDDEAEEEEMEDPHIHMHNHLSGPLGAGIALKWGCVNTGEWSGSCDIGADGHSIKQPADWSAKCDPWKKGVSPMEESHPFVTWSDAGDYEGGDVPHKWTCPEKYRSPSGCGDFRTDPRKLHCDSKYYAKRKGIWSFDRLTGYREERIQLNVGEPLLPQKHVCVQRPIFYEDMNTENTVTPPMVGRHRERWPKWGEYEYLPPQRWLHGIEHGGFAFLYNHCLPPEDLCSIRRFIQKWKYRLERGDLQHSKFRGADRGMGRNSGPAEFRFILTPFKDLQRALAVVSWGEMYMSKGFNEAALDEFITENYRKAWEDYQSPGKYNYTWVDINEKDTLACADDVDIYSTKPLDKLNHWTSSNDISLNAIAELRGQQAQLHQVANTAVGISVVSCVATLIMMLIVFRTMKRNVYDNAPSEDSHLTTET